MYQWLLSLRCFD